jgi:hypothetical protein
VDIAFQVFGALLIVLAFTLAQLGMWDQHRVPYLSVNLVGSVILAVDALAGREWGFVLLEVVWAAVSLLGLARRFRTPALG